MSLTYNKFKDTTIYGNFINDSSGAYIANALFKGNLVVTQDISCNGNIYGNCMDASNNYLRLVDASNTYMKLGSDISGNIIGNNVSISGSLKTPYASFTTGQTISSNYAGNFIEVLEGSGNTVTLFDSSTFGLHSDLNTSMTLYNGTGSDLIIEATVTNNITPLLYFPFDNDYKEYSTGTGLDVVTNNGCSIVPDSKVGGGCVSNVNTGINSLDLPPLPVNVNGYTIAFWFQIVEKTTSQGDQGYIFYFHTSDGTFAWSGARYLYLYYVSNKKILFCFPNDQFGDVSNLNQTFNAEVGIWYHVAVTLNTSHHACFYLNGTLLLEKTNYPYLKYIPGLSYDVNKMLLSFSSPSTPALNVRSKIDEFYYFDGILNANQIATLYNKNTYKCGTFIGQSITNATSITMKANETLKLVSNGYNWILDSRSSNIPIGTNHGEYLYWDSNFSKWTIGGDNVSIGTMAGNGQNINAVAIGFNAGAENQGIYSVALGGEAGHFNQGWNAIAIGGASGNDHQGEDSIGIGNNSGCYGQGTQSIAIGNYSGFRHQGNSSLSIGNRAGYENQPDNTIVLNATGNDLNGVIGNAWYVAPIRNVNGMNSNLLAYDDVNKEIYYTTPSFTDISCTGTMTVNNLDITGAIHINPIRNVATSNVLCYDTTTKEVTYTNFLGGYSTFYTGNPITTLSINYNGYFIEMLYATGSQTSVNLFSPVGNYGSITIYNNCKSSLPFQILILALGGIFVGNLGSSTYQLPLPYNKVVCLQSNSVNWIVKSIS